MPEYPRLERFTQLIDDDPRRRFHAREFRDVDDDDAYDASDEE